MNLIENRLFDDINIGDSAHLIKTLEQKDIQLFAVMSGDINPMHIDKEFAQNDMFHEIIAHGMWGGSLISTVLGTQLPGPGTIYLEQSLKFLHPIYLNDTVTVTLTALEKDNKKNIIQFGCKVVTQKNIIAIEGTARVIAPKIKISRPRQEIPQIHFHDKGKIFQELISRTQSSSPIITAVVHPVDSVSLVGAIESAQANLITPILIGPEHKIKYAAKEAGINIEAYTIIPTLHSHAAAAKAVELARAGDVQAIMKGALHTDELMHEVVSQETGLLTARRISHVFIIDVPTYNRPLLITDAAINVYPSLEDKRDIVQNAIDLAIALGIKCPHVAILSAIETVYPKITSTIEAAALCKMAERGQITGGILDGPLAFDTAISKIAAQTKGLTSVISGDVDILVVPDLESGNMLAKQLEYLAEAQVAGIVLGARIPIILTSRADGVLARMTSCALAKIMLQKTTTP
ncbi:MAG: bifunctional enoyl-CoA hydratase/phosphate acetyltransferase [Pseudomonadota bacterium]